eukprot:XP_001692226.1 predicted protein [Chlamydomonas reinhardtii]
MGRAGARCRISKKPGSCARVCRSRQLGTRVGCGELSAYERVCQTLSHHLTQHLRDMLNARARSTSTKDNTRETAATVLALSRTHELVDSGVLEWAARCLLATSAALAPYRPYTQTDIKYNLLAAAPNPRAQLVVTSSAVEYVVRHWPLARALAAGHCPCLSHLLATYLVGLCVALDGGPDYGLPGLTAAWRAVEAGAAADHGKRVGSTVSERSKDEQTAFVLKQQRAVGAGAGIDDAAKSGPRSGSTEAASGSGATSAQPGAGALAAPPSTVSFALAPGPHTDGAAEALLPWTRAAVEAGWVSVVEAMARRGPVLPPAIGLLRLLLGACEAQLMRGGGGATPTDTQRVAVEALALTACELAVVLLEEVMGLQDRVAGPQRARAAAAGDSGPEGHGNGMPSQRPTALLLFRQPMPLHSRSSPPHKRPQLTQHPASAGRIFHLTDYRINGRNTLLP